MIGFSEVTLTEQTVADYADTLAYLGAAIRPYRDPFRRLGLLGGQGQGEEQGGQDGDGQQPTGKTSERFKVACGCQPSRSFWIRAKQCTGGPSPAAPAAKTSNPNEDAAPGTSTEVGSHPGMPQGSSGGVEADPRLVGQDGDPLGCQHRRGCDPAGRAGADRSRGRLARNHGVLIPAHR